MSMSPMGHKDGVKSQSFSGTTGNNDYATFSLGVSITERIVVGIQLDNYYMPIPYVNTSGFQGFFCFSYNTTDGFKTKPNTAISGTYYYIEP